MNSNSNEDENHNFDIDKTFKNPVYSVYYAEGFQCGRSHDTNTEAGHRKFYFLTFIPVFL